MRVKKSNLVTLSLLIFSALAVNDLRAESGEYSAFKYASIVAVFLSVLVTQGIRRTGDGVSVLAMGFFIFFVILFTLFNSPDVTSLAAVLGYVLCAGIYVSSAAADRSLAKAAEQFLLIFTIFFVVVNFPQIFNPNSYSAVKNQFSGILSNANAFSGLCGFVLVFSLCRFFDASLLLGRFVYAVTCSILVFFMLLSSSRGALLSVFLSVWFIPFGGKRRRLLLFILTVCAALIFLLLQESLTIGFAERDLFEETGRSELLTSYLRELAANALVGVGLSESGGRIKSELSYLDILLFAGVGGLGFFVFLLRGVYFSFASSFSAEKVELSWAVPVYVYICVASIFEGYAANIASVPSIFLYISAGLVFQKFKLSKRLKVTKPKQCRAS